MKRVFHPYTKCEEYAAGMWRIVTGSERDGYIRAAADLMRDAEAFYEAMMRAVREWPFSCEAALTAGSVNKKAWMGHAGCCLAAGSPEDLTRLGWHMLTPGEQDRANEAALKAIAGWESLYLHRKANPRAEVYTGRGDK